MNSTNDIFDARRIKLLVDLMQENDLTELDLQQGEMRIQLKRNSALSAVPAVAAAPPVPAAVAVPVQVSAVETKPAVPAEDKNVQFIKSPMVGTFYAAASPNDPPFAGIGDSVSPEKTVCLIEAMKVYNEIQAECSGKILAVLVKNGQTVEYGTPLFKVSAEG
ncbi:MAG: acetyl-CoA carboxylase biotin carboxyl carrier protein [Planctomycetaceae bacterium]|jgi:acetyl-CoA carboxylase biotin carboxyl carrier protein|nr:acetyl-CoA carboxylase biotin carboxyl carrier protein [Planctomycetaceae bacterium]